MKRFFQVLAGLMLMCSMSGCCLLGHGAGYGAGYPFGGGGCGSCGGGCGVAPGGFPQAVAPRGFQQAYTPGFAPTTAFAQPTYPIAIQSIPTVR